MTLRKDAVRNRAALLRAAGEVFGELGADAPLDVVAQRAGLGRGTLYRHFPDRGSILASIIEDRLDTLERFAAQYDGDDLVEQLIVEMSWLLHDVPGLMSTLRSQPSAAERLGEVTDKTARLILTALERAQQAGLVRSDVGSTHVLVAFAMLDGVSLARTRRSLPEMVPLALELILRSLRTPDRAEAPIPERRIPFPAQD